MEDFSSGLILMVVGMGVVFVFLIMMIGLMTAMSKIVNSLFPETVKTAEPGGGPTGGELAAITSAVHHYIRSKK